MNYSVKVDFPEVPANQRIFGASQVCLVDWGLRGVYLVPATDADRAEFGPGVFRAGIGELQYESIVRIDPKGMRLFFVDAEHYENTDEVQWQAPTKIKRLAIFDAAVFESAFDEVAA